MREEVFRLEQVSIPPVLHDIHLHLYRGEIVALIGLNALGIDSYWKFSKERSPPLWTCLLPECFGK